MQTLKPILKWAGSKRWIVPKLKEIYNPKYRLVEPFVGSMAVSLGLQPEKALLTDINSHLINLYQQVKLGLKIDRTFYNADKFYYECRAKFNHDFRTSLKEEAELFYYLNRTCFNGLCRFNSKGEFNVPFGKYKTINYKYDFTEYKSVIKNWEFRCVDFSKLEIEDNDWLYIDPPYDTDTSGFTSYAKEDFDWGDQLRLINWVNEYKNPIVISNKATDRIVDLYSKFGFRYELIEVRRRISCNGDRKPALEIIAYKNI